MVSHRCQHLIASLIQDKQTRLCSSRYQFKDLQQASPVGFAADGYVHGSETSMAGGKPRDAAGRYVFPADAEDIKAHRWFKGVPWQHLHQLKPPFVPTIRTDDDTHYFEEEEPISDWGESSESSDEEADLPEAGEGMPAPEPDNQTPRPTPPSWAASLQARPRKSRKPQHEDVDALMGGLRDSVQDFAMRSVAQRYDTVRLRNIDAEIHEYPDLTAGQRDFLRQFVRTFGRKERKRPRDRLLRDRKTKHVVMDVRKRTAFLGYTWRRMRAPAELLGSGLELGSPEPVGVVRAMQ
jgi:protein-serine/threonine kinase